MHGQIPMGLFKVGGRFCTGQAVDTQFHPDFLSRFLKSDQNPRIES